MKRVKVVLIDGTCHDIANCEDIYCPSSNPKYVRIESGRHTYVFNMDSVEYVEIIRCDEEE